jgi:L-asparaginase II
MATPDAFVPLAIASRNDLDESVHFGAAVGLASNGDIEFAWGDPGVIIYPRSSLKPMQAVGMVRAGLRLSPELLAVVCASHDGTTTHQAAAEHILRDAGLTVADLGNVASLPLDEPTAYEVLRHGGGRTALQMNCSGKHAGMLATCVLNGWVHDATYLDQEHPLQQAITATVDDLCSETHDHIGVDGCGAPTHAMSLLGLARAFRAISNGDAGGAGCEVHDAMTSHPVMVGGEGRDVTTFMRQVPGLMAKDGADGVFAAALPDGRSIALKIADGANRARPPVMVAALARLGVDVRELAPLVEEKIMGHGRQVGVVRAITP